MIWQGNHFSIVTIRTQLWTLVPLTAYRLRVHLLPVSALRFHFYVTPHIVSVLAQRGLRVLFCRFFLVGVFKHAVVHTFQKVAVALLRTSTPKDQLVHYLGARVIENNAKCRVCSAELHVVIQNHVNISLRYLQVPFAFCLLVFISIIEFGSHLATMQLPLLEVLVVAIQQHCFLTILVAGDLIIVENPWLVA